MTAANWIRGYPDDDQPACMYWPLPAAEMSLREWQSKRCALCGMRDRLVRDHDHSTGLIRGLLCTGCNTQESRSSHPAVCAYREGRNPATLLGIEEIYLSPITGLPVIIDRSTRGIANPDAARILDR